MRLLQKSFRLRKLSASSGTDVGSALPGALIFSLAEVS